MAATVEIDESNGSGETVTNNISNINFGNIDSPNINTTLSINAILAGNNSYEKWLRYHITDTTYSGNVIDNLKVWKSAGVFVTDESIKTNLRETAYSQKTYVTPVATTSTNATLDIPTSEPTGPNLGINGSLTGSKMALKWDLSTALFSGKESSILSEETAVQAMFFKPDGTKFFICGNDSFGDVTAKVHGYDLSTAWDASTASFGEEIDVSGKETAPRGLFFKPDGTKMYITGFDEVVYEYDLSTAWDVSSSGFNQSFSYNGTGPFAAGGTGRGMYFKPDGTKMFISGARTTTNNDTIAAFDLSTGWNVSTAVYNSEKLVVTNRSDSDIAFSSDGVYLFYFYNPEPDKIYTFELSTAWDVSTGSEVNVTTTNTTSPDEFNEIGIWLKPDATRLYIAGSGRNKIYQHEMDFITVPSDYIVMQLQTTTGTPPGDVNQKTITLQYDEAIAQL